MLQAHAAVAAAWCCASHVGRGGGREYHPCIGISFKRGTAHCGLLASLCACTDGAVPRNAHHKHSFSFWRGRAAGAGCESSDARRGGGHSGGPRTGRSWRHLQRASVKPLLLSPNSPLHKNDKMCRWPEIFILAFFVKKILKVSKCTTGVQGNYTHSHSGPQESQARF